MKKNKTTHFMSGILILVFVAIFLTVTGRFLYIQATGEINGVSLDEWAAQKRTTSYNLPANRGKIMDSNGMTLAYDRPTFRVYAIVDETYTNNTEKPMHVVDPEKTAEKLAPILDMDKASILKRLEDGIKNDKFQVEFGSNGKELTQQTRDKINKLHLPGIKFDKEALRYYPNGMFASQIIGFARKNDDGISGVTGMENQMNKILAGKQGHISYKRDKYSTKLLKPEEVIQEPEDGNNVYLTIDQKVQTILEDVMSQVEKKYKPKRMTAIVMNPKNGEIVAMSNRPSYNPNKLSDVENWYNDAISTPFEPGSTMKMFTWAAAIEEGVYNGDDTYKSGQYKVSERDKAIRDWKQSWGTITYDQGFQRSSNVAAAKLAWEKIGSDKYLDYLKAFDFDEKTGIDLPGEVPGKILYDWPIEKVTSAFGQGTTLTPIQQMKAASAIANDGKMVKPYVISKITDSKTGEIMKETKPEVVGKPISKGTADHVRDLLETVVTEKHGTGKIFHLENYSVAGKTGTAQLPDYENGGYLLGEENYVFSFLGMAPKDDPQLMMYVSVKQPKLDMENYESGSVPVSFIFNNVMKNSLRYLNIEPDKDSDQSVNSIEIPEITGEPTKPLKKQLTDAGLDVTTIGNGKKVVDASVSKGDKLLPNDHVLLVTDKPAMPDITGWSLREVLRFTDLLQLKAETIGNGYVVSQSIEKGKTLHKNDYLAVDLQGPDKEKNKKKKAGEE
ncbi:penicillin-binding protein [Lentibacillus sp. N15]|uniref:penicillin-binding protein n=1 Tax=Lentibacillus songyuanensis TaxID=3136161 RepID=UPI0031B9ECA1